MYCFSLSATPNQQWSVLDGVQSRLDHRQWFKRHLPVRQRLQPVDGTTHPVHLGGVVPQGSLLQARDRSGSQHQSNRLAAFHRGGGYHQRGGYYSVAVWVSVESLWSPREVSPLLQSFKVFLIFSCRVQGSLVYKNGEPIVDDENNFPDGTEVTFNCIETIMGEKTTWKIVCEDGSWIGRSLNCGQCNFVTP